MISEKKRHHLLKALQNNKAKALQNNKGYSTVFLCMVVISLIGAFTICYSAIAKVGAINEQLRQSKLASEMILSYYHDGLEEAYGLLAYNRQMPELEKVMTKRFGTRWSLIPTQSLDSLSAFQKQGVALGKTITVAIGVEKLTEVPSETGVLEQNESSLKSLQTQIGNSNQMEANKEVTPEMRERAKKMVGRLEKIEKPNWQIKNSGEVDINVFENMPKWKSESAKSLNLLERGLLTTYIMETFNEYVQWQIRPESRKRQAQLWFEGGEIEYILAGHRKSSANQVQICTAIFAMREPGNILFLVSNTEKRREIEGLSLMISSVFPLAEPLVQAGVVALWASMESGYEVSRLLEGNAIPVLKRSNGDWYTDLESDNPMLVSQGSSSEEKEKGLDYRDFLRILLMAQSDQKTAERTMSLIDINLKKNGMEVVDWSDMLTAHRIVVKSPSGKESSFEDGYLLEKKTRKP